MSEEKTADDFTATELMRLTVDVAVAFLSNNTLPAAEIPELMNTIHKSIRDLDSNEAEVENTPLKPAVPIRRSITDNFLICLEDGKQLKMLKRHLRTAFNMSPEQYRAKWGLPATYPMVAPNYAAQRSAFAKKIGLGKGANKRGGGRGKAS